ncbi:MAG: Gfo/Idh/MocA family oxidoreductase [Polyangia bacterium]|nr:Gfo/Idh/MocA family oxidoreductase [Polyangia bacterium]
MKNFALIGAAGFVAPRHLKAIQDTGNRLVAATDPHDAVGVLDRHAFDVRFFPEIERFDRHLEKLRRGPEDGRVHWVTICSPNYLHDAHVRLALRVGANALCEKPLVINPWNLDALEEMEREHDRAIHTILQLRVHPALLALREGLPSRPAKKHQVELTYVTGRGAWYLMSWKGQEEKSGGVSLNIGIHFFDMLLWLFGPMDRQELHLQERTRMSGYLSLRDADVRWFLSVDPRDLPGGATPGGPTTFRSITMDGAEIDFTQGFTDLHTRVYEKTLAGEGFRISDARPSIEMVYKIRTAKPELNPETAHPFLQRKGGA